MSWTGLKAEPQPEIRPAARPGWPRSLDDLAQIEKHYLKKENQLFPAARGQGRQRSVQSHVGGP